MSIFKNMYMTNHSLIWLTVYPSFIPRVYDLKLALQWNPKEKLCESDDFIVPLELCKITRKTCRYLPPAS